MGNIDRSRALLQEIMRALQRTSAQQIDLQSVDMSDPQGKIVMIVKVEFPPPREDDHG